MIEISHGWTPTTPAIQPAEGCSVPTLITQSKNSLGCSSKPPRSLAWSSFMPPESRRIPMAASLSRPRSSLGTSSSRSAAAEAVMRAWVSCMGQPFRERSRTTLARVTATTRPAP